MSCAIPTDVFKQSEQLDLTNKADYDRKVDYAKEKGHDVGDEKATRRLKFRYLVLKYTAETLETTKPT